MSINVVDNLALSVEEAVAMNKAVADAYALETVHFPTIRAGNNSSSPGQQPTPIIIGQSIPGIAFTVNTDDGTRLFKIDNRYAENPTFHVHWTKSSDLSIAGQTVQWRVTYTVYDGASDEVSAYTGVVDLFDTYEDSGTTTRVVYRTANIDITGFVPRYYVGAKIEAVTPDTGTPVSEPVLISLDLMYRRYLHDQ